MSHILNPTRPGPLLKPQHCVSHRWVRPTLQAVFNQHVLKRVEHHVRSPSCRGSDSITQSSHGRRIPHTLKVDIAIGEHRRWRRHERHGAAGSEHHPNDI